MTSRATEEPMQQVNDGILPAVGESSTVIEEGQTTQVVCPHPGCEESATAPVRAFDGKIVVTRSAALFGEYDRLHCPAGHKVFVHYC